MEQLVTVSAHVECAWLASLRELRRINEASNNEEGNSEYNLWSVWLHKVDLIAITSG